MMYLTDEIFLTKTKDHSAAATSEVDGGGVDMWQSSAGPVFDEVTFLTSFGTPDDGNYIKVQQSDDTVTGNFADITGATVTVLGSDSVTPGVSKQVTFSRDKRYLRAVGTIAGTGSPAFTNVATFLEQKKNF